MYEIHALKIPLFNEVTDFCVSHKFGVIETKCTKFAKTPKHRIWMFSNFFCTKAILYVG